MYTTKERIAIARIVSDMIKADNIIEESEIEMLNKFRREYNIDSRILSEARFVKFSTAVSDLSSLEDAKKIEIFKTIRDMAIADGECVPKEAMLLLALRYAFGIERDKINPKNYIVNHDVDVKLISCPTGETSLISQYVIYIEGARYDAANEDIKKNFEVNVLNLRQWGFDFVYIPLLIEEFSNMNEEYVKDVVSYMAPELPKETIDIVYERLLRMDTITFCNHVLAKKLNVDEVKNAVPSLFINIGTSIVPYCSVSGPVDCYTEFLCIPLTSDITSQIKDFIRAYSKLVSFHVTPNYAYLDERANRFKYFGFYKAMFDFLVKAEPKESDIIVYPYSSRFEFPQIALDDLKLSPQEAALYKLILECTYKHPLHGLPTSYTKYQKEIYAMYAKIYHKRDAIFPDNIAPIRSRIEAKMRKQLDGLANLEEYIPKLKDGKYIVSAPACRIKIRDTRHDQPRNFNEHSWE